MKVRRARGNLGRACGHLVNLARGQHFSTPPVWKLVWHRLPGEAFPSASASKSQWVGEVAAETQILARIFSFSCFPLGCELFTGNYLFYFLPPDFAQSLVLTMLLNICFSKNMFLKLLSKR